MLHNHKPSLFLLHFAGGNCYSFQAMAPFLKDFDVVPLELPGRGKRHREPLLKEFDQAADDVYRRLRQQLTAPDFLVYGHSMGAYLGLRVTNRLESEGISPRHLLVSGNPGPGIKDDKCRYRLGPEAFKAELLALGGVPQELLQTPELYNFFEPILRADFEVAEKNDLSGEPAVGCPLFAMMGSREEKVEELANWGRFTRSRFGSQVLEGDHFFIHKHPARVAGIIRECYRQSVPV